MDGMNLDRFSQPLACEGQPFMVDDISNDEWCECGQFLKLEGEEACEDCLETGGDSDEKRY